MPLKTLQLRPGIFRENTRYAAENGWYECDKIRFRLGQPEKIGGWEQISNDTFQGVARALWPWSIYMGVGTNLKYYIFYGAYYDITPIRATTTLGANPFALSASNTVTVTHTAHGAITGDFVTFSGATDIGGAGTNVTAAVLNTEFQVTVIDVNTYTIQISVTPNATALAAGTGGGTSVSAAYQLNVGSEIQYPPAPFNVTVSLPTDPFNGGGTTTVTVTAPNHGQTTGTLVSFSGATSIGGVTISGQYALTVVNPNSYTITYPSAVGGPGGGSSVQATYQPVGTWGSGGWGSGVWGGSSTPFVPTQIGLWNAYNFGLNLIYGPKGGGTYYWVSGALAARGVNISTLTGASDTPSKTNFRLVSDASRFVLAFGTTDYGSNDLNPMLIRWSDQESVSNWTPSATTQAGSLLLSHGSEIMAVAQTRQEIIVWTDTAMYSLQYLGPPIVWGSQILADNITIASDRAWAVAAGVVYWMGDGKFYVFDGRTATLQCDIRKFIFDDFNGDQNLQVFASTVEQYNEVWWFYCSANSTTVDRYAVYNYLEKVWYYGTLARTAWIDASVYSSYPIAADYNKRLIEHEKGCDDKATTTAAPITAYIISSEFDIDDGHNFGFVTRVLPDVTFAGSTEPDLTKQTLDMALLPMQNSGSGYTRGVNSVTENSNMSVALQSERTIERVASSNIEQFQGRYTGTITPYQGNLYIRVRGRQMAVRAKSTALGVQWQLGKFRIDLRPDGRKS